jgi:hypothetical protein
VWRRDGYGNREVGGAIKSILENGIEVENNKYRSYINHSGLSSLPLI